MGLAIAVFVPEGIVIASDGLEEVRNTDDGYLHKNYRNVFTYANKYLVCIQSRGYMDNLPWGFYVNRIFGGLSKAFSTTTDFAIAFNTELAKLVSKEKYTCYVAGIDESKKGIFKNVVLLIDNGTISTVSNSENATVAYNYHSIGRSIWIDKMLLPTSFEQGGQTTNYDNVDIDFSKYSTVDAEDFALTLMNISRKLDRFAQLKQMVGENIHIGVIQPLSDITIKTVITD